MSRPEHLIDILKYHKVMWTLLHENESNDESVDVNTTHIYIQKE